MRNQVLRTGLQEATVTGEIRMEDGKSMPANMLRAAAELGISRMGLYKKLHKYGMMSNAP